MSINKLTSSLVVVGKSTSNPASKAKVCSQICTCLAKKNEKSLDFSYSPPKCPLCHGSTGVPANKWVYARGNIRIYTVTGPLLHPTGPPLGHHSLFCKDLKQEMWWYLSTILTLHYGELSKGKVHATFEIFKLKVNKFLHFTRWTRRRMKHIYQTFLNEMKSSYFTK